MDPIARDLVLLSAENKAVFDTRVEKIVKSFLLKCKKRAKRGLRTCNAYYLIGTDTKEVASAVASKLLDTFKGVTYNSGVFAASFEVEWPEEKKE